MSAFSERLRYLRKQQRLSQGTLAEKLGVSLRNLQRYEQGGTEAPVSILSKLADIFGVTTDYLLGRTDTPGLHFVKSEHEFLNDEAISDIIFTIHQTHDDKMSELRKRREVSSDEEFFLYADNSTRQVIKAIVHALKSKGIDIG